jgi:hypothetical protein
VTPHNKHYLRTKREKMGHTLPEDVEQMTEQNPEGKVCHAKNV